MPTPASTRASNLPGKARLYLSGDGSAVRAALAPSEHVVEDLEVDLALSGPAGLLEHGLRISNELVASSRIGTDLADRAGEVGRVVGLVVLEHAVAVGLRDGAQPRRDHRPLEQPVVDHLVGVHQVRVRRGLLRDDADVGRVQELVQTLVRHPPLEADDVLEPQRPDLLYERRDATAATRQNDSKVGHLVAEEVRCLDDRVLAVAILDEAV